MIHLPKLLNQFLPFFCCVAPAEDDMLIAFYEQSHMVGAFHLNALFSTTESGCRSVVISARTQASNSLFLALPGLYLIVRSTMASILSCFEGLGCPANAAVADAVVVDRTVGADGAAKISTLPLDGPAPSRVLAPVSCDKPFTVKHIVIECSDFYSYQK